MSKNIFFDFYVFLCEFDMHVIYCLWRWQQIGGVETRFLDLRGCRMVFLSPRRSQVAFWRLLSHSDFKRKPTGKSTKGHRKYIGGKTTFYKEAYKRRLREVFTIFRVWEWVKKVDQGWNEVLGCLWSTMNHQEREQWLDLLKERGRSPKKSAGN